MGIFDKLFNKKPQYQIELQEACEIIVSGFLIQSVFIRSKFIAYKFSHEQELLFYGFVYFGIIDYLRRTLLLNSGKGFEQELLNLANYELALNISVHTEDEDKAKNFSNLITSIINQKVLDEFKEINEEYSIFFQVEAEASTECYLIASNLLTGRGYEINFISNEFFKLNDTYINFFDASSKLLKEKNYV